MGQVDTKPKLPDRWPVRGYWRTYHYFGHTWRTWVKPYTKKRGD